MLKLQEFQELCSVLLVEFDIQVHITTQSCAQTGLPSHQSSLRLIQGRSTCNYMSLFEVICNESGRRVAVATKDILPGTLLFIDEPLLVAHDFPPKSMDPKQIADKFRSICLDSLKLPQDEKERFFSIFAPERPAHRTQIDRVIEETTELKKNSEQSRKAIAIFMGNMVSIEFFGQRKVTGVYEKWSFVQHNCGGNCARTFSEQAGDLRSYCRAARLIHAGEFLTVLTVNEKALKPTHERRAFMYRMQHTICHCSRCDAEGDDTRRFNCFDVDCKGCHLVCEPIGRDLSQIPACMDGVKYVTPHLLPCTVCRRSPSQEYQQKMFRLEAHLCRELDRLEMAITQCIPDERLIRYFDQIQALPIPRHHAFACRIALFRSYITSAYCRTHAYGPVPGVLYASPRADIDAAVLAESILGAATLYVLDTWCLAASTLQHRTDLPELAKSTMQKYLRVHYIVKGRERRREEFEKRLLIFLQLQPVPQEVVDMAVCAFCEESPQRAALTLSKCARCKKVVYCSKGCQKAHWPLHKQHCEKNLYGLMKVC